MPIEPPDPGFVSHFLKYFLAVFSLGGVLFPTAVRRWPSPRKRR
ncbi:hypothetical protein [Sorangium sp. So ce381]